MNASVAGEKLRWTVSLGGAVVLTGALLVLFRSPAPPASLAAPESPRVVSAPTVQVAKATPADALLSEEIALRDMRPLFVPTEWNATVPEPRREPGRSFLENETVRLNFPEAELTITRDFPAVTQLAGKPMSAARPADALAPDATGVSLMGIGRGDPQVAPAEKRGGFVEVFSMATGQRIVAETLAPGTGPAGEKPWSPAEFLAVVDAAGLAVPLVLTEGSRVEEVDSHYRSFLPRTFRLGERLDPGFYRVVVSP